MLHGPMQGLSMAAGRLSRELSRMAGAANLGPDVSVVGRRDRYAKQIGKRNQDSQAFPQSTYEPRYPNQSRGARTGAR